MRAHHCYLIYVKNKQYVDMNGITAPSSLEEPGTHDPLWRYMSITKFLDLITTGELFCMKGNQLQKFDKYEGVFPFHQINEMSENLERLSTKCWNYAPEKVRREYKNDKRKLLSFWNELCYVSCWHGNSSESNAMWKLYASSGPGVAIRTNYYKISQSLSEYNEPWFIARVKYIDPALERIAEDNLYYPLFHKRLCFDYEKEVRIVFFQYDEINSVGTELRPLETEGIRVPIDLEKLIEYVVPSPESPSYFESVLKSIISKYGYDLDFRYPRVVTDYLIE